MITQQKAEFPDNRRLLVIDDNPKILADFRKILTGSAANSRSGQRRSTLKSIESTILGKSDLAPEPPMPLLHGFELDTAERGQDGLEMLKTAMDQGRPYSVAFVDMRMPNGWDGVETIEQLWKADPRLQVVICTAYSDHSWEQTVARLGNSDGLLFLKKPFDDVEICQLACALSRKWTAVETANRQLLELRASEAEARKLALVASRTHNGVVITDAQGRTQWVNDGFVRMTGYTLDELIGRTPGSVLQGPMTDVATINKIRDAVARGEGFDVEIQNYRKDGTRYWVAIEVQPIRDAEGNLVNFMAIESDVTVRKQAAEELARAKEAAEAANRAKGEFLANISHEIRTPMTAIIGYSDLMVQAGPHDANVREWAIQTQRNADYLLSLLNDILDFSKIEAGRVRISRQPCGVIDIVTAVTSLLAPQAAEKGIELKRSFASAIPDLFETDAVRLRQILTNMLSNAVKFTNEGSVELRVGCARHLDRPVLEFEVIDTGIGMPPDRIPMLFTPFTQVYDRKMLKQFNGSGLGLAISQELAGMLGGAIEVTSEVGKGSKFTLRLPLSPEDLARPLVQADTTSVAAGRPKTGQPRDIPQLSDRRILVVDDNPDNRIIIEFLLTKTGAQIGIAKNGQECLDAVFEARRMGSPFDIVLLDMSMPVMDGYQAAAKIREAGIQTPIIALTAFALADDQLKCRAAGCDSYLSKPIVPQEFYQILTTYLDPARPLRTDSFAIKPPPTVEKAATKPSGKDNPLDLSGDPEIQELATRYVASLADRIKVIQTAWREQDIPRMRTQIHQLRGTGANFGFGQITKTAADCEQALDEGRSNAEFEVYLAKLIEVLKKSAGV